MKESIDIIRRAVEASNAYESSNSELKRQYIKSNIILYNDIARTLKENLGTFGTGYPFYIWNKNFEGAMPIIGEQLRYNRELLDKVDDSMINWECAECLSTPWGRSLPDLKQFCKSCPAVIDELKPRKVINRLPDLDMWMICDDTKMENAKKSLAKALGLRNFNTSDIDPVQTIYDLSEIAEQLEKGTMPDKYLPIDTHLIDKVTLHSLINQIPYELERSAKTGRPPYLAIQPWSLRRDWKKDSAYNFVHDYLSSLTEFEIPEDIQKDLNETRKYIAKRYSFDKLYEFLLATGPANGSVARRHKNPALPEAFKKRVDEWREMGE